jgi:ubiquinone/menaquinone biosynthesis C-methylase UbiE
MFPKFLQPVSLYFRSRRNRRLCALIDEIWAGHSRPIEVLDVGGSLLFWLSIPEATRAKCNIRLLNLPEAYELACSEKEEAIRPSFTFLTGDARDLSLFADKSLDLVICNSVIEHVGTWADMTKTAKEILRTGKRGWVQVPAFEFPLEQHFLLPMIHWFADPVQIRLLKWFHGPFKSWPAYDQQMAVQHMRPLTRSQIRSLFPDAALRTEWFVFPKSHMATW